jgi:hypothetical protein
MKILILYQLRDRTDRSTIYEHLYSFKKFNLQHNFHYLNVFDGIPDFVRKIKYDAVILHYTFLAGERFLKDDTLWLKKTRGLEDVSGYKIAIPQDEYDHTERLCNLFKRVGVQAVYTCFEKDEDIVKAYPYEKTGVEKFFKVYTGYVDEKKIPGLKNKWTPYGERPIDIGYRARMLPAYFGRHGQLKYRLVGIFNEALKGRGLNTDIQNTNHTFTDENVKVVKHGRSWYDFLLSCKAFIGCEGGSSLLDFDGSIKERISEYCVNHPKAEFDEIEENCFKGLDYNISCFALSPRHFEAVMTKTLQILVEGTYGGIFKAGEHYISIKADFSNLDVILATLKDDDYCQKIVDQAFIDIALSGKYTYAKFVGNVIRDIEENCNEFSEPYFVAYGIVIKWRNRYLLNKPLLREAFFKSDFFKSAYPKYVKYVRPYVRRERTGK